MKYIKTYENKFSQYWSDMKNMWKEKSKTIPIETYFNDYEIKKLKELDFQIKDEGVFQNQPTAEYISPSSNLKITIKKQMEEFYVGYAEPFFSILKNDINITPTGKNTFDIILNLAKHIIPEIDNYSKQYNL